MAKVMEMPLYVNLCCFKLYCAHSIFSIFFFFQMLANFSGIEFYKTVLKFRERKIKLFSCVMPKM